MRAYRCQRSCTRCSGSWTSSSSRTRRSRPQLDELSPLLQSERPSSAAPPFSAGANLVTLEQVLRFAAIYFVPPYGLAAVAVQIEGVSVSARIMGRLELLYLYVPAVLIWSLFMCTELHVDDDSARPPHQQPHCAGQLHLLGLHLREHQRHPPRQSALAVYCGTPTTRAFFSYAAFSDMIYYGIND